MKEKVEEWIKFADLEFKSAMKLSEDKNLTTMAAFHCQQSVEKYLKAMIEDQDKPVPKIHNLSSQVRRLATTTPLPACGKKAADWFRLTAGCVRRTAMINIVTGPIRSGKTTALERWVEGTTLPASASRVDGVLTPDGADGRKVLCVIGSGETFAFEVPCDSCEQTVDIGPYCFLASTFDRARSVVTRAAKELPPVMIVDELGKLELRGQGFEPALSQLIAAYRYLPDHVLVLVIRDFLLSAVQVRYSLSVDLLLLSDDPSG